MVKRISWLLCVFLVGTSGLLAAEPTPLHTLNGHSNSVEALVFSHDGKTLVSGSIDRFIKFWDVSTGKPVTALRADGQIECLASFPKGDKRIASGGSASGNTFPIALWDVVNKKKIATTLGKDYGRVLSIAISPNGKTIATGSLIWSRPRCCRTDLWDAKSDKRLVTLTAKAPVPSLAFSPDSTMLATAEGLEEGNNVKLWDATSGKRLATLSGHTDTATSVTFSPDGKLLASGSSDGTIRLWDVATRKNTAILKVQSHVLIGVDSIAFHPDGKILAAGGSCGTLRLWDVTTGKLVTDFKTGVDSVLCVVFSPDGKTLASSNANINGTIQLWDVASLVAP